MNVWIEVVYVQFCSTIVLLRDHKMELRISQAINADLKILIATLKHGIALAKADRSARFAIKAFRIVSYDVTRTSSGLPCQTAVRVERPASFPSVSGLLVVQSWSYRLTWEGSETRS